ncbi:hypothetical protein WSS15_18220 [Acetobacter pasteurianus]|nr:hypothetical protein WSS15_18220 [Acetobacter pasteurianus]
MCNHTAGRDDPEVGDIDHADYNTCIFQIILRAEPALFQR